MKAEQEQARLETLRAYEVLDTPREDSFDEIVRLTAAVLGAPAAMVSLIDEHRQWFKAKVGVTLDETPRDIAFCSHAIAARDVMVVPDATADPRFANNPLVTGNPNIRFYAGAPLVTSSGAALGTLCVIDYVPRDLTPDQRQSLLVLSRHVTAQLDLRKQLSDFARAGVRRSEELGPLYRALERNEFVLHYQPKVNLRTGEIVGVEALIRWNDPDSGMVSPAFFVPKLEDSGLIVQVGAWALQQACSDFRDWSSRGLKAPRIAVNVSPVQVRDPTFTTDLAAILGSDRQHGIDIEITEGLLLEKSDEAIRKLRLARELGAKISIDDFGTGYSSLGYLTQLPIDCLKIDRSFVTAMGSSAAQFAIVSSVITLAHGLGLTVTAEGVENEKQRRMLTLLRCDEMQGFLHSRPMPKEALEQLLQNTPVPAVGEAEFPERRGVLNRDNGP